VIVPSDIDLNPFDPLEIFRLRLGSVAYLNAAPLTYGWEEAFSFEHPAVLADKLRSGELDGALAPIHALLDAGSYVLVDGVGICANGPVYSVGVVSAGPLEDLEEVALTDASRSSRNLVKVLYDEFMPETELSFSNAILPEHTDPAWREAIMTEFVACHAAPRGLLLIGDRAIAAHRLIERGQVGDLRFHDLSHQWRLFTNLPFVFAMWGLRADLPEAQLTAVARELRAMADEGLARRREISREPRPRSIFAPDEAYHYLTEFIRYEVGEKQRAGIAEYLRLLKKHGWLPAGAGLPRFV
jgi:chorismate dehydratase